LVAQEIAIASEMSVEENISLGHELRSGRFVSRRRTHQAAGAALSRLSTTIPLTVQAGSLRPSEQRIVMIAAALFRDARLVIMDEPTAGMGLREAEDVLTIVGQLASSGVTVIYVSHRLDEVLRVCDIVTLMRDGRRVTELRGDELTRDALIEGIMSGAQREDAKVRAPRTVAGKSVSGPSIQVSRVTATVLDGCDFRADAGEVVGVIGTLESGVTELLEVLVGIVQPHAGTIEISGERKELHNPHDALKAGIGYLSGGRVHSAVRELPVRENISLPRHDKARTSMWLITRRSEREAVTPFSDRFGLTLRLDDSLLTLSGGNQQKGLLARLLFAEAGILVLEDPTLGVDIRAREELLDALREVADEGRLVIVYSSEPTELVHHANRVCVFRDGRVATELGDDQLTEGAIARAAAGFV
jgi:ribose transport system ATP-binding protein